ncbi:MAG: hypothetical protein SPL89_03825 [Clostridia bacterium]|nr:hypothetical protein [Clostridia bacterium]
MIAACVLGTKEAAALGAAKRCKRSDLCIGIVSFFAPHVHVLLILAALYFSDRISHMLKTHSVAFSEFVENDLFNL